MPQEYVPDLLNNPERTISQPKPDILYGYLNNPERTIS
jgi:hypothetical protein